MSILESLLYGLVSGISEFLPISSYGHQILLKHVLGVTTPTPIADLLIHIALLLAVIISNSTYISRLRRERLANSAGDRRFRRTDPIASYDNRLIQTATVPMIIVMCLFAFFQRSFTSMAPLALCFLMNGIILYIPEHLPHGNKDSRQMSMLDSIFIGLSGALSILPGFSRVGASMAASIYRGYDKTKALGWIYVISIPAILCYIIFDFITMFTAGVGVISFIIVIGYLVAALVAFVAAFLAISIVRYLVSRSNFSGMAFYCWGAALLAFIFYLTA